MYEYGRGVWTHYGTVKCNGCSDGMAALESCRAFYTKSLIVQYLHIRDVPSRSPGTRISIHNSSRSKYSLTIMDFIERSSFYEPTGTPARDLKQLEIHIRDLLKRIQTTKKSRWWNVFSRSLGPDFGNSTIF